LGIQTHTILFRKERKERNSWAEGRKKEKSVCSLGVLRRMEKQARSGCKKLLAMFSNQDDKRGCREDK
jgi:hypothetical protein